MQNQLLIAELNRYLLNTYQDSQLTMTLYGVLKHSGIYRNHPYYDDLLQECRLTMAHALHEYDRRVAKGELLGARQTYAYQRMRWVIFDYLRRNGRDQAHCQLQLDVPRGEDDDIPTTLAYEERYEGRAEAQELIEKLLATCSPIQARLIAHLRKAPDLTNKELATLLHISAPAVSYHKKLLRHRLQQLTQQEQ